MEAGLATGLAILEELNPVAGDHEYDAELVAFTTFAVNEAVVDPLQIVTPPPEIVTVGGRLLIPVIAIPPPALVIAVVVSVLEPITPYFVQGNDPVYFAPAIFASVPTISEVT